MKKFILGLFLILGAMSFAVPNYVNTTKIKSAGYEITTDDKDIFGLGKVTQEAAISVAIYPFGNNTPQSIADAIMAIESYMPLDFIEVDFKNIWDYLGYINGDTVTEDLLDTIFSNFCIGK